MELEQVRFSRSAASTTSSSGELTKTPTISQRRFRAAPISSATSGRTNRGLGVVNQADRPGTVLHRVLGVGEIGHAADLDLGHATRVGGFSFVKRLRLRAPIAELRQHADLPRRCLPSVEAIQRSVARKTDMSAIWLDEIGATTPIELGRFVANSISPVSSNRLRRSGGGNRQERPSHGRQRLSGRLVHRRAARARLRRQDHSPGSSREQQVRDSVASQVDPGSASPSWRRT